MRNWNYIWVAVAIFLPVFGLRAIGADAKSLLAEFEESRTKAYAQYRNQELSVSGKVTGMLREFRGLAVTLDDAVTVKLGSAQSEVVKQIEAAQRAENDRVDNAVGWRNDYERKRRRNSGNKNNSNNNNKNKNLKPYNDSMNPHGPTKENLQLSITATGICKGIRSSKILLDPVSNASLTVGGGKGKGKDGTNKKQGANAKKGGKSAEMAAALKRDSWNLKGVVYVENGQRYFAPDKNQHGVDVWPINLPQQVGGRRIDGKLNNKRGEITVAFKPTARGDRGIKPEQQQVKSLKLQ